MRLPNSTLRRLRPAGFSLVELLLTVSLLMLLAGAVILNFGTVDRTARLEEGAAQMETLFRYSRAQAASTGRQVRIVFSPTATAGFNAAPGTNGLVDSQSPTNAGIQVQWEPNPVEAPGQFENLPGAAQLVEQVNDLVKVQEVCAPGAAACDAPDPAQTGLAALTPFAADAGTNSPASGEAASAGIRPLTCYPDGSSDSLVVTVASTAGPEETRLAVVTFSGVSGAARHRLVTPLGAGAMVGELGREP